MSFSQTFTREQLLAAERGYVRPAGPVRLAVALVYPNSYHIGMSSLGYQIAYRVLNDLPGVAAERFFMDTLAEGSIESGAPLSAFDVVAISASFEMDEPNILDVIEAAGAPILARERSTDHPLIVMGGVLVSVNRLPLFPFIDLFLHGDAEVVLPPLANALLDLEERGVEANGSATGRAAQLEALSELSGSEITPGARLAAGMHVDPDLRIAADIAPEQSNGPESSYPTFPTPPAPAAPRLADLETPICATQILTPHCEFSDMVLVDLARGCPHHCTFCWIGHNSPPYRARSLDTIFAAIERWDGATDRFGLVSSAVGAHPDIDEVCRWAMKRGLSLSYSSLRVEEVTPIMLEALVLGGQRSITIAPEAGNPRVRRLLGKRISDEEILNVVEAAMSLGAENIKLYYMIGVPSETDDEALDIVNFSLRVREIMLRHGRPRGRIGQLGFNLGVFVPKPNIPLNHIEPVPLDVTKRRLKKVVKELQKIPNSRLAVSSPDLAVAQSVLSVGGIEASRYLTLVRSMEGDWRRANRAWRADIGRHFESHRRRSRTAGSRIQSRATGPVSA